MIYKFLRKQVSMKSALQLNKPELRESQLIQQISRMIKNIKKKEILYNRMVNETLRKNRKTLDEQNGLIVEFQNLIVEMKQLEVALSKFKNESFYASKNYFYAVFMRISEFITLNKQKCQAQGKKEMEKAYEALKRQLEQIYLNQAYELKYQIMAIFDFMNKNQQTRLNSLIPKKLLAPLYAKKQRIFLQKLKSPSLDSLKRTQSIEFVKKRQFQIDQIINKKLNFQLATEKRMKQRQNIKIKKNLFRFYDILQVKPLNLQNFNAQNQEATMIDRNAKIKQSMKKWEKKYLLYKFVRSVK